MATFRMPKNSTNTDVPKTVFVDCVTGRHEASDPRELLDRRALYYRKEYGWTYDALADPKGFSLAGANGRFSLFALGDQCVKTAGTCAKQVESAIWEQLQRLSQSAANRGDKL